MKKLVIALCVLALLGCAHGSAQKEPTEERCKIVKAENPDTPCVVEYCEGWADCFWETVKFPLSIVISGAI